MKFEVIRTTPSKADASLMVFGLRPDADASTQTFKAIDRALRGRLATVMERLAFKGKLGQTANIPSVPGLDGAVLLVGLGGTDDDQREAHRAAGAAVGKQARSAGHADVALFLQSAHEGRGLLRQGLAQALGEGIILGGYRYDRFRAEGDRKDDVLAEVTLHSPQSRDWAALAAALNSGACTAEGQCLARDLVNGPANLVDPAHLKETAEQLGERYGLELNILDKAACLERGMGGFLAVNQGSRREPWFVHAIYRPEGTPRRRVCLVGKAVTFDSGGLSIKPAKAMEDMKIDMGGAAAVIGTMKAVASRAMDIELHIIFAATENMTGDDAYRPGDVITASNGKTIEVLNTDAEGRLTLADALVYASDLDVDCVIDMATLTGACMVALGHEYAGLFTHDEEIAAGLLEASEYSGDKLWRMPLPDSYKQLIKSDIAEVKNLGGRFAGATTAALFLQEFVGEGVRWAHLDIAGPVTSDKPWALGPKGATGHPVRALVRFLES